MSSSGLDWVEMLAASFQIQTAQTDPGGPNRKARVGLNHSTAPLRARIVCRGGLPSSAEDLGRLRSRCFIFLFGGVSRFRLQTTMSSKNPCSSRQPSSSSSPHQDLWKVGADVCSRSGDRVGIVRAYGSGRSGLRCRGRGFGTGYGRI